jgi:hypothetical protein
MALIEFVRNYYDRSTDRGYQFEFHCDQCYSGFLSSFQPSFIGAAGGLMEAAGNIFGGLLGSAGSSAYSIQRAISGPVHDRALQQAVTEVKERFRRCQLCGKWVCADVCWNERASQCTRCTPKYEQEAVSSRVQAQVQATQDQLREKAAKTDYVTGVDMQPDAPMDRSGIRRPLPTVLPEGGADGLANPACTGCGTAVGTSKFCPECGMKVVRQLTCAGCGQAAAATARFCGACGASL